MRIRDQKPRRDIGLAVHGNIRKNKKHYKNLLLIYLKTIAYTLKWYRETIEKTYAPGGKGYFEARDEFLRIKDHIELEKIKC